VLVGDGGEVLGRFNLVDVEDGSAELGYRVAEHAAGQGLATAAVRGICWRPRRTAPAGRPATCLRADRYGRRIGRPDEDHGTRRHARHEADRGRD
jgi:ribosomal-protein-alanine N-acetyltransferase